MSAKTIDAKTLKKWMDAGQAVIVDVREPSEFAECHIKGAHLIPSGSINCSKLPEHKGKKLVFHCKLGRRGAMACDKVCIEDKSLQVYNLEGGITAWQDAGFPVEKGGSTMKGECHNCCMKIENKIRVILGGAIVLLVLMGHYVAPFFYFLAGLVGAVMAVTGITGKCMLRDIFMKMDCPTLKCDHPCDEKGVCADKSHGAMKAEVKKVEVKKAAAPAKKKKAKKK